MRRPWFLFGLLGVGCATSIVSPTGGQGGGGSGGAGGDGGAGGGGSGGDGGAGPCFSAADCAGLTDACNVGTCVNGACEKQPANEGSACDDGKSCTVSDTCQDGACTSGNLKFCPSSDNCHIGYCDPDTDACTQVPGNDGATCVDDDACTDGTTCSNGACVGGFPSDCTFLDDTCAIGACDPQTGCFAIPQADGAPCDDGLFCTVSDTCSAGQCAGLPNPCGAPNAVCSVASCDEATDTCTAVPGNDGAGCDDGSACTTGETCSAGSCTGGAPANQGGACDDGDACTTGDTCAAGVCSGAPIVACANGDGCCPAGCDVNDDDDCKLLDVAVMQGDFYTDGLRAHLATQPFIASAVNISDCSLATLQQYDVVVIYGNMFCFDAAAFDAYVQNGGGLVATPWVWNNNGGLPSLPVSGNSGNTNFSAPLDVTVTAPADPLLQGVSFVQGDPVGMEDWSFTLKPGAVSAAYWNGLPDHHAVARWAFGSGRSVYLDFHYVTSDCSLAWSYDWGKKLAYNATLWAGKVI